ncbi:hypothetical protein KC19_VG115300, partial [Ceratodon purpureus]
YFTNLQEEMGEEREEHDFEEGRIGEPTTDFMDSQEGNLNLARESSCDEDSEDSFDEGMYSEAPEVGLEQILPWPPKLLFCPIKKNKRKRDGEGWVEVQGRLDPPGARAGEEMRGVGGVAGAAGASSALSERRFATGERDERTLEGGDGGAVCLPAEQAGANAEPTNGIQMGTGAEPEPEPANEQGGLRPGAPWEEANGPGVGITRAGLEGGHGLGEHG